MLSDCVHCGFCLPTCPTYVLWGEEMDSPRGRIHLMEQAHDPASDRPRQLPDAAVRAFDNCLGCLACVSSCPSGVRYDQLIESTRAAVEQEYDRPWTERLLRAAIFALFPYRRRLAAMRGPLRAYQASGLSTLLRDSGLLERLSPTLATMERISPPVRPTPELPDLVPARGRRRAVVGMLTGCVQGALFPQVNTATARVLAMEGCDVVIPREQGCCGALSAHAGRSREAAAMTRATVRTFERAGVDRIVVNSAGCGSTMKHYPGVLDTAGVAGGGAGWRRRAEALSARVVDLTELLVELGPQARRHPLPMRIAYHDACHLAHGQGVTTQPRALLRAIPQLELAEIADPEVCCGSAGVYNLLNPDPAHELGMRKATDVAATAAEVLVAGNPGCSLQISAALEQAGTSMAVAHTAQVLDASLRGLSPEALRTSAPNSA
ncbi:heterodisulfide reductase-related iron-sulfur binding cluster [Lipingzhangella sp. LS1_29]|uniref:Glycolate oxidase iron-sulfur subunit n=1 Tax=Lipingzhangella rawalii TaxID=2055835 RepID=A0ABU2HAQ6_9ACTN|nr:heterodisulfide reductase-related iron-sulfur binding cluster [Lipingzhangella rawalii]MDS1271669.1 heterodisulfide reductase-related iron-sulfur binding cluster [Lipingzhangella rawalii]